MPALTVWNNHWGKQRVKNQTTSYKTPSNFLTTNYAGKQHRLRHWLPASLLCKLSREQLVARMGRRNFPRMWGLRWHSLLFPVDDWVKHMNKSLSSCPTTTVDKSHISEPLAKPCSPVRVSNLYTWFIPHNHCCDHKTLVPPQSQEQPWNAVPPTLHFWYANSSSSNMYGISPST